MSVYKIFSFFSKNDVSAVSLVIANLMPLFGVLFWDWSIFNVMILYWTESAIIGFYNALKVYKIGGIKKRSSGLLRSISLSTDLLYGFGFCFQMIFWTLESSVTQALRMTDYINWQGLTESVLIKLNFKSTL